jgi:hypothetical protein
MLNQDNSNSGKMIKIVLAKIAAEKQAKTKRNSASLLLKLGVTLVVIACYGFLYNQDTDWAIILIFGSIVTAYGAVNLKE